MSQNSFSNKESLEDINEDNQIGDTFIFSDCKANSKCELEEQEEGNDQAIYQQEESYLDEDNLLDDNFDNFNEENEQDCISDQMLDEFQDDNYLQQYEIDSEETASQFYNNNLLKKVLFSLFQNFQESYRKKEYLNLLINKQAIKTSLYKWKEAIYERSIESQSKQKEENQSSQIADQYQLEDFNEQYDQQYHEEDESYQGNNPQQYRQQEQQNLQQEQYEQQYQQQEQQNQQEYQQQDQQYEQQEQQQNNDNNVEQNIQNDIFLLDSYRKNSPILIKDFDESSKQSSQISSNMLETDNNIDGSAQIQNNLLNLLSNNQITNQNQRLEQQILPNEINYDTQSQQEDLQKYLYQHEQFEKNSFQIQNDNNSQNNSYQIQNNDSQIKNTNLQFECENQNVQSNNEIEFRINQNQLSSNKNQQLQDNSKQEQVESQLRQDIKNEQSISEIQKNEEQQINENKIRFNQQSLLKQTNQELECSTTHLQYNNNLRYPAEYQIQCQQITNNKITGLVNENQINQNLIKNNTSQKVNIHINNVETSSFHQSKNSPQQNLILQNDQQDQQNVSNFKEKMEDHVYCNELNEQNKYHQELEVEQSIYDEKSMEILSTKREYLYSSNTLQNQSIVSEFNQEKISSCQLQEQFEQQKQQQHQQRSQRQIDQKQQEKQEQCSYRKQQSLIKLNLNNLMNYDENKVEEMLTSEKEQIINKKKQEQQEFERDCRKRDYQVQEDELLVSVRDQEYLTHRHTINTDQRLQQIESYSVSKNIQLTPTQQFMILSSRNHQQQSVSEELEEQQEQAEFDLSHEVAYYIFGRKLFRKLRLAYVKTYLVSFS